MTALAPSPRHRFLAPAAALVLALGLRLVFWFGYGDAARVRPDTMTYWTPGRNLLAHGVFSMAQAPPWHPYIVRTPVYPVFLAVLSEGPAALGPRGIAAVQVLLSLATLGAAAWLAGRLGGRRAALAAAFLLAADAASAVGANLLLSETLFAALLAGWLLLLLRADARRWGAPALVALGVASGLLALCRPIALMFPLVAAAWLAWGRRGARPGAERLMAAVWLLVGAAMLPGAWMARNWADTGVATISTIGDVNLYAYRAAWNEARRTGRPFADVQRECLQHMRQLQTEGGLSETQVVQTVRREALHILLSQPRLTATQGLEGLAKTLLGPANAGIDALLGPGGGEESEVPVQASANADAGSDGGAVLTPKGDTNAETLPPPLYAGVTAPRTASEKTPAGFRDSLNNPDELRPGRIVGALAAGRPAWVLALKALSVAQLAALYAGIAFLAWARRRVPAGAWRALALLALTAAYFVLLSAGAEANSRFRVAVAPELCVLAAVGWSAWAGRKITGGSSTSCRRVL